MLLLRHGGCGRMRLLRRSGRERERVLQPERYLRRGRVRFRRIVVPRCKQRKSDPTVLSRVLVMISKTIHILIPPLAWRDLTAERPELPLRLALAQPFLAQGKQLRARRVEALAVREVVLEPVRLFVRLHAPGLRALERFLHEERRRHDGRRRRRCRGARSRGGGGVG